MGYFGETRRECVTIFASDSGVEVMGFGFDEGRGGEGNRRGICVN